MFTLGMSPEQEERDGMQSYAGREALGEGPLGSVGRDAGRQQMQFEHKGGNGGEVNGRALRGTRKGKGDVLTL